MTTTCCRECPVPLGNRNKSGRCPTCWKRTYMHAYFVARKVPCVEGCGRLVWPARPGWPGTGRCRPCAGVARRTAAPPPAPPYPLPAPLPDAPPCAACEQGPEVWMHLCDPCCRRVLGGLAPTELVAQVQPPRQLGHLTLVA